MEIRTNDMQMIGAIRRSLENCILGKSDEIERLLAALLAGGHVLLEDVPGTGKTQLVKALARAVGGQFRRIQCNPDLLPTDITGVSIYHPKEEAFIFRPGPIMANILLADEINRATTKTQSALLEAMEERHVTVDGISHPLPSPFILFATQNPIEFEGTYLLPEAQLDRFMMRLTLGYPDDATEKRMVLNSRSDQAYADVEQVAEIGDIARIQERVRAVHVDEAVADYLVRIIRATREHHSVQLGASPRASISLMAAAKAHAYLSERDYVIPDDIKRLAGQVLSHRILLHMEARMNGETSEDLVGRLVQEVSVPVRLER
ncbi:magnesium chelatase [Paenibacillus darwinianus]|uniref:Magnesium chelatase n=1 Tax=Paenibacillus darwinianus TaxID=1380763 RepID=A0A9W5RZ46_9BACL|nr:MoxR family ATPase [Paenibacillus darwinianus]EXX86203.1 magnesium chelatase [Paenibacillus darwinianus]EXX86603.1 magnesium chelatase [Paenibacillus darwinianus]EXX89320.1 magnesium chelatase [Paenibacillus darwinianus]